MPAQIPSEWESIAQEIQVAALNTAVEGFFIISLGNARYPDLYIQGTWNDEETIWIEVAQCEDVLESTLKTLEALGWTAPDDDLPNHHKELNWDEAQSHVIAEHFIEAIRAFNISAEDCELEVSLEFEK